MGYLNITSAQIDPQAIANFIVDISERVLKYKSQKTNCATRELYTLQDLQDNLSWDWGAVFSVLFSGAVTVNSDTVIRVYNFGYFYKITEKLMNTVSDQRLFEYYFQFLMMLKLSALLPGLPMLSEVSWRYSMYFRNEPPRWLRCLRLVDGLMPKALAWFYHRSHVDNPIFSDAPGRYAEHGKTISSIIESIAVYIGNNRILPTRDRITAVTKMLTMKKVLFFPTYEMESELERIYTTKPTRTSNVLATAVDMVRCDTAARFNYSNFLDGDPMFPVPDQTLLTECRYIHQENLLYIPHAVFHGDYFDEGERNPVFLAKIGHEIGRALVKVIDPKGTCYSQDREEIGWLSETGRTNYDKVRACVRSLYNVSDQAFKVHFFRLKAAEDAHPKPRFKLPSFPELSQDRIFFYSFGESFCEILPADALRRTAYFSSVPPNKIRLNTMLRNEDLFGKVFDCKPGSPMRPTKKQRCKIWPLWTGELIEPVDVYSAKAREY